MRRLLLAAAALFLVSTSLLAWQNATQAPWRFDWPDETGTAFFLRRAAAGRPLAAPDPDIAALERRLHPRSVNVLGSSLVPAGFLGMPILGGAVGRLLGPEAALFLNPLLAVAAALALARAVRGPLSARHATLSAVLFLAHPATLYFSSFALLPNVAFLSLLVLAAAGAAVARTARRFAVPLSAAAGIAGGLAFAVRLSEAVWAVPLLAVLLVWAYRGRPRAGLAWVAGAGLALLPFLFLQQVLYGSPLAGYARLGADGAALPSEAVGGAWALLLPFGVHPWHAAVRFWDSFLSPFWWYALPASVGLAMAGYAAWAEPVRVRRMAVRAALAGGALVAGYLVLLYGSWVFADPLTLLLNTIGRSYVRYWLPIALLMSVAAAAPLARLEGFPEMRVRIVGRVLLGGMALASVLTAFVLPREAVLPVRERIAEYKRMAAAAEAVVPEDGIILTERLDKVFFPERRVIALEGKVGDDRQAVALVAAHAAEYRFYFADALSGDEDVAARSEFLKRGISATEVARLREDVRLYALTRLE